MASLVLGLFVVDFRWKHQKASLISLPGTESLRAVVKMTFFLIRSGTGFYCDWHLVIQQFVEAISM